MNVIIRVPHIETDGQKLLFGIFDTNNVIIDSSHIKISLNFVKNVPMVSEGQFTIFNDGEIGFVPFPLKKNFVYALPEGRYELDSLNNLKLMEVTSPFMMLLELNEKDSKIIQSKAIVKRVLVNTKELFSLKEFLYGINGEIEREQGDQISVRWDHNGYTVRSIINKITGKVIEAGFCLSGNDAKLHANMLKVVRERWDNMHDGQEFKGILR